MNMNTNTSTNAPFAFPLAIQTVLPGDYQAQDFRKKLSLLQKLGFSGVELNIACPEKVAPADLKALLGEYGLRLTMFASGATAKAEGRSLSDGDEGVRGASIERCKELVDYAAEFGAGVIVGFLKGGVSPDPEGARRRFRDSIASLEAHVRARQVPLLIEATNRYESSVANSLQDAAQMIEGLENPYLRILPDTFHMNIEERSMTGALIKYRHLYDSVHISDNNRLFPGLGAIDFFAVLRFLRDMGYSGGVAIEGNVRQTFEQDVEASVAVLNPMLTYL